MKVLSYKYILPSEDGIVDDLDRSGYMTPQYINMMREFLGTIQLNGKVAFLYAGGVLLPASEGRVLEDKMVYRERLNQSGTCIKEVAAYSMHKWIGELNGREYIQYANINGNTCASSMYSLYEAEQLLNNGYDEVVIVAEEKTSYNTLRIFDEHGIDLKVGEGCAVIHLGKDGDDIHTCKWSYEYNRNPFGVTQTGYSKVWSECDIVKPHGTGTENNESAESIYRDTLQLRYKEKYGHTQGVSGLLEVCLALDESIKDTTILCISSGLGGFYGSCIIQK